jgi:hypothetical protein
MQPARKMLIAGGLAARVCSAHVNQVQPFPANLPATYRNSKK